MYRVGQNHIYHIYTNIPCMHVGYRNAGEGGYV